LLGLIVFSITALTLIRTKTNWYERWRDRNIEFDPEMGMTPDGRVRVIVPQHLADELRAQIDKEAAEVRNEGREWHRTDSRAEALAEHIRKGQK
jgi:hypothetical protein